jgi:hypothetical protein
MSNYTTRNRSFHQVSSDIAASTIVSEANTIGVRLTSNRPSDGRIGKGGTDMELIIPVDSSYARGVRLSLSGRQARVLYTTLARHFKNA